MTNQRGAISLLLLGIIAAVVLGIIGGAFWKTYSAGYDNGKADEAAEWAKAKAKLEQELAAAKAEAATKIDDMTAAYEAGVKKGKAFNQSVQAKGVQHVAAFPVFNDPDCVLPADSLSNLKNARLGVRSSADPGTVDAIVPPAGTGSPRIGAPSRPVPANASGR
jgi:hypothetical protein